jgi:hypothetical protein
MFKNSYNLTTNISHFRLLNSTDILDTLNAAQPFTLPSWSGYILLLAASFFYGSCLLPVKKYDIGDALFFQLLMCISAWTVGFVVTGVKQMRMEIVQYSTWPIIGGILMSVNIISIAMFYLI